VGNSLDALLSPWARRTALVAVALLLAAAPLVLTGYWLRLLTSVFMLAIMAESVNLITGFTGYPALGNGVFFGVGAYALGVLMTHGRLVFWAGLPLAGLVCALYAFLLGFAVLRAKGHYFLMATLGVMEATREVVKNLDPLTGGDQGLFFPVTRFSPAQLNLYFFYVMFGTLILTVGTCWLVVRSRLGYAFRAIKASETAAGVLGINTTLYKTVSWAISAFFTGLAGGIYGYWATFIEPPAVFDILLAIKFFVMMLLGGPGTIFGPVLGAFLLEISSAVIWGWFPRWQLAIIGTILILVILLIPNGVAEFLRRRLRHAGLAAPARQGAAG
jgi:branched-chain amino acid transport system permease protein